MATTETPAPRKISEFMTPNPCTVAEELTLADAQERMFVNNIRHLVVTDSAGVLRGVISSRDVSVSMAVADTPANKLMVGSAMAREPFTVGIDAHLEAVAEEMERHRIGCAVILKDGSEIAGIFTTTDALRAVRELATGKHAEPRVHATHNEDHSNDPHVRTSHRIGGGGAGRAKVFTPS